ncbi:hypothetical protein FB157_123111 [Streptomyces sp. BK340]|nr:hypothetical protein FB157_123111 [Streptomyces sp. BK340]
MPPDTRRPGHPELRARLGSRAAHPAAIERCDSILVGPKRSLSLEDGIRSALDWMPVRDELVKD